MMMIKTSKNCMTVFTQSIDEVDINETGEMNIVIQSITIMYVIIQ